MFGIPIGLLIRIGLVLALMAALAYAYHLVAEHFRIEGRAEIQTKWDADKAERIKRTTDMTNLWDSKRQEADKAGQERDHERAQRLADAQQRAKTLPPAVAGAAFPGAAVQLLNEPTGGHPAQITRPAGPAEATAPAAAGDSTVGAVTEWGVTVKGMYQACLDRVAEHVAFYQSLRDAQPKEQP